MSVRFVETLSLSGIRASIGSVGDAYDNAVAGTTSASTKPSASGRTRRFAAASSTPLNDVEYITADYVAYTTSSASCTASAEYHPPKPRPATIPNA